MSTTLTEVTTHVALTREERRILCSVLNGKVDAIYQSGLPMDADRRAYVHSLERLSDKLNPNR